MVEGNSVCWATKKKRSIEDSHLTLFKITKSAAAVVLLLSDSVQNRLINHSVSLLKSHQTILTGLIQHVCHHSFTLLRSLSFEKCSRDRAVPHSNAEKNFIISVFPVFLFSRSNVCRRLCPSPFSFSHLSFYSCLSTSPS